MTLKKYLEELLQNNDNYALAIAMCELLNDWLDLNHLLFENEYENSLVEELGFYLKDGESSLYILDGNDYVRIKKDIKDIANEYINNYECEMNKEFIEKLWSYA